MKIKRTTKVTRELAANRGVQILLALSALTMFVLSAGAPGAGGF